MMFSFSEIIVSYNEISFFQNDLLAVEISVPVYFERNKNWKMISRC